MHSLKGLPHVIDVRNLGLVAGIELEPRPGRSARAATTPWWRRFRSGLLIRVTGDIIALSPPLIIERTEIEQIVDLLGGVLRRLA